MTKKIIKTAKKILDEYDEEDDKEYKKLMRFVKKRVIK